MEERQIRIHIGNISPKLAETPEKISKRLESFGSITAPLELHTKPVEEHFFGYVTMNITLKNFQALKKALHNVLFMGKQLTVNAAKQPFVWKPSTEIIPSKERVQLERSRRISEYNTNVHTNPLTSESTTLHISHGYSKSPHTFNNMSGNTKNAPPSTTLIGPQSYGALTKASKFYDQAHAMTSGGGEVIRGRVRKTPRSSKAVKDQTLRILVNGELKQFKAYKTKLWGMEKNKTVRDLTWKYSNGAWRSGDDHVVERVQVKRVTLAALAPNSCAISGDDAQKYGENAHETEEADEVEAEKAKNLHVLSSMFASYDFDKPVELEDVVEEVQIDSKGRKKVVGFDYEVEHERVEDNDMDVGEFDPEVIKSYKKTAEKPAQEVYYSESDSGNELDFDMLNFSTENMKSHWDVEHNAMEVAETNPSQPTGPTEEQAAEKDEASKSVEEDSDSEAEPMPTFGAVANANVETEPSASNTEALRALFNPQETTKFSLSINDEDIDKTKPVEPEVIVPQATEEDKPPESSNFGLFWLHQDSPFLQTQTQLSKLGSIDEKVKLPGEDEPQKNDRNESPYEAWFWKMRGEVTRECKRRKRDALRAKRKTNKVTV